MDFLLSKIDLSKTPKHIAVIMDGNGRWAKKQNKPRTFGHQNAIKSVNAVIKACKEANVSYLTLFAFSTENWTRPTAEINLLFKLLNSTIKKELDNFLKEGIKLKIIGNKTRLPENVKNVLDDIVEKTKHNKKQTLIIALDYGSKEEIVSCAKKIAMLVKEDKLQIKDINEAIIEDNLYTNDIPQVDLLIRTSGEKRISNFLLWQIAYAEFYFTPILWPDFREPDLYQAIIDYQSRERRFGNV